HVPAVWRNLQIFATFLIAANITKQSWFTAAHVHCPRLLLWNSGETLRVRGSSFLVNLAATGVNDDFPVGRQAQARNCLSIVACVMRHLARREIRRVCDPNVAFAFTVEHPRHAWRVRRAR